MSARWSLADLEALKQRAMERGNVRTHIIQDEGLEKYSPRRGRAGLFSTGPLRLTEVQVLRACLNALNAHPKVAFAWRQNVGAFDAGFNKDRTIRRIRFAFAGCSDILGCLKGGRWLAVECKATGKKPSAHQISFLDRVNAAGGLGVCVDDAAKLVEALESA